MRVMSCLVTGKTGPSAPKLRGKFGLGREEVRRTGRAHDLHIEDAADEAALVQVRGGVKSRAPSMRYRFDIHDAPL